MMAPEPLEYQEETDYFTVDWIEKDIAVCDIEALMGGTLTEGKSLPTVKFLVSLSKEDFPMIEQILSFPTNHIGLEPVFVNNPREALYHVARLIKNLPIEDGYAEITEKLIRIVPDSITNLEIAQQILHESLLREMFSFLHHYQDGETRFEELNRGELALIIEMGRKITELVENLPSYVYRESITELFRLCFGP